jgi:small-conductance mechanosensitive channel
VGCSLLQRVGNEKEALETELNKAQKVGNVSGQYEVQAAALERRLAETTNETRTLQQLLGSASTEIDTLRQMVRSAGFLCVTPWECRVLQ